MVCFIILHYMALDETIRCIQSIKKMKEQEKNTFCVICLGETLKLLKNSQIFC